MILIIPVSQRCILGFSTAATSNRLKVDGYRKKKEIKLESHTSWCSPGTLWSCHNCSPSYLWLMKYTCMIKVNKTEWNKRNRNNHQNKFGGRGFCASKERTHNSTNSQWQRCPSKQNTESSFSNEFLTHISEASQATVDNGKNENKGQHHNLQKRGSRLRF